MNTLDFLSPEYSTIINGNLIISSSLIILLSSIFLATISLNFIVDETNFDTCSFLSINDFFFKS